MKVVVFDWDGTVVDNFDHMYNVFTRQVLMGGGVVPSTSQFLETYEPPHQQFLLKCGARITDEEAWRVWLETPILFGLHDGVTEVLQLLQTLQIPCYIATANQEKRIREQLEKFSLASYFSGIYSEEHKHLSLLDIAQVHADERRSDILYIGDMRVDMAAAVTAQVTGVGIASSRHKDIHMKLLFGAGAKHVFPSMRHLHQALISNFRAESY